MGFESHSSQSESQWRYFPNGISRMNPNCNHNSLLHQHQVHKLHTSQVAEILSCEIARCCDRRMCMAMTTIVSSCHPIWSCWSRKTSHNLDKSLEACHVTSTCQLRRSHCLSCHFPTVCSFLWWVVFVFVYLSYSFRLELFSIHPFWDSA